MSAWVKVLTAIPALSRVPLAGEEETLNINCEDTLSGSVALRMDLVMVTSPCSRSVMPRLVEMVGASLMGMTLMLKVVKPIKPGAPNPAVAPSEAVKVKRSLVNSLPLLM